MSDNGCLVDLSEDRKLVEECQAGNLAAFDQLYARYFARLTRFCHRRLGSGCDAEDVAQETFFRAWKALPSFSGEKHFYPWLTVIAAHLCTDRLRSSARCVPVRELAVGGHDVHSEQEERLMARAEGAMAREALHRIPPRHREILLEKEDKGWTCEQIATHHDVSVSAVMTTLWRARQELRRAYSDIEARCCVLGSALFVLRRVVRGGAIKTTSVVAGSAGAVPPGFAPVARSTLAAAASMAALPSGTGPMAITIPSISLRRSPVMPLGAPVGAMHGTGTVPGGTPAAALSVPLVPRPDQGTGNGASGAHQEAAVRWSGDGPVNTPEGGASSSLHPDTSAGWSRWDTAGPPAITGADRTHPGGSEGRRHG